MEPPASANNVQGGARQELATPSTHMCNLQPLVRYVTLHQQKWPNSPKWTIVMKVTKMMYLLKFIRVTKLSNLTSARKS